MTGVLRFWRRAGVAHVAAIAFAGACATGAPRVAPPPHTLTANAPLDRARLLVRAALDSAGIALDGNPPADADVVTGTFVVRRGGMGEAEIRVRLRLTNDGGSAAGEGVVLAVDATARDRHRAIAMMTPEEARSPRMSNVPHPIQSNDRDALQRIGRLLDQLRQSGFVVVAPSPTTP